MSRTTDTANDHSAKEPDRSFDPMPIRIRVKREGELAIGVFLGRLVGGEFFGDYQLQGESETRTRLEAELHFGDSFGKADIAYGSKLYRAIIKAAFGDRGNRRKSG